MTTQPRTRDDLDTADRQRRAGIVEDSEHQGEMEGMRVTPETMADARDYVEGRIDSTQLRQRVRDRVRARYADRA